MVDHVREVVKTDQLGTDESLSWAAYRASYSSANHDHTKSVSCLLPLFYEDSKVSSYAFPHCEELCGFP